ncbi:MAG: HlyD family efflux transporter periplasmic adaptor subunit, partial [Planctomycetota bacterium]|nr:HlyD family efflux transporter periplasmic adaptor subunit [Planctomycetota bacterium]
RTGLRVALPILVEGAVQGAVAWESAELGREHAAGFMQRLRWGVSWLEVLFLRDELRTVAGAHLGRVIDWLGTVLDSRDYRGATLALTTAMATVLDCDRVCFGRVRRGGVRLAAVSHSASFGARTTLARAVEAAMDEACDQGQAVLWPEAAGAPFQVRRSHEALGRETGGRAILSVPLTSGLGEDLPSGCLTLERSGKAGFTEEEVEAVELASGLLGPVLELARLDELWIGAKAWQAVKRQARRLRDPGRVLQRLTLVGSLSLTLFFACYKTSYRVAAPVLIEPAMRRAVAAPFTGFVGMAEARAGDLVNEGDILCALETRELILEKQRLEGEKEEVRRKHAAALATRNASEARILEARARQVDADLDLVRENLVRAVLRAPFDGLVVLGDLSQEIGAPVEQGLILFEVAPLGGWRVVLQADERDVTELEVGQSGTLVLSSAPGMKLPLVLDVITPVSSAGEGVNSFRVEATLTSEPDWLRPGMEGLAKVDIEERLLIWTWTHRAFDWLRIKLWGWMP